MGEGRGGEMSKPSSTPLFDQAVQTKSEGGHDAVIAWYLLLSDEEQSQLGEEAQKVVDAIRVVWEPFMKLVEEASE